jgi:hypothetical protein
MAMPDRRGTLWCAQRLTKRLGCRFLSGNDRLPRSVHRGSHDNHCHVSRTATTSRSTGDVHESFASYLSLPNSSPMSIGRRALGPSVSTWAARAGVADTKHRTWWLLETREDKGDGIHQMDPHPHSLALLHPSLHLLSLIPSFQILATDHHNGFKPPTLLSPHQGWPCGTEADARVAIVGVWRLGALRYLPARVTPYVTNSLIFVISVLIMH